MVALNQLQKALVNAGLADPPKEKKRHYKKFKCHQCNSNMIQVPDTNTMACERCGQYFVFKNN